MSDMPKVADLIAERYELLAHLGDGGSASVWQARDRTLEREVAIKFLYVADERDADVSRKQFLREARIACAVKHRNVIQTVDFGQTEEGRAYMVMELLHGEELTQRIGTDHDFTPEVAAQVVGDVLRGLQAIHEAGIVHRDLKPENIYLERDQDGIFPKILDFGIAKSIDRRGNRRSVLTTKEGIVVGTPEYMSPEQARGQRDLDARADVWSVGVILFELLTGKLPFDDPSEAEVIIKIVTTEAPKVRDLKPEIPVALSEVVSKALQRDRAARFQSAAEMNQALLEAAKSLSDAEAAGALRAVQRRGRTMMLLSGAGALALFTAILLISRREPAHSVAPAAQPAAKPASVRVALHGVPSGATVLVNGKTMNATTFTLPNDGHSRLIEVQIAGRNPWRVMHPAGNDADYEVRMPLAEVAQPVAPELTRTTSEATPGLTAGTRDEASAHAAPVRASPSAEQSQAASSAPANRAGKKPRASGAAPGPTPARGATGKKPPGVWRNLDF
jgi:serine/threonine-protein kinase